MFIKYQHVEKYSTDETENINLGDCYVFPKIDGTNGSIYCDEEKTGINIPVICAGSRNRELTLDNDNQGFYNEILKDDRYYEFFCSNPHLRLYGEFLIPHSLKTYRNDAWKKFYIFDVMDGGEYIPYDLYKKLLDDFNLDYIPCIAQIKNGSYEQFINIMNQNNWLVEDGKGLGEGIVIKNYEYINKYGRVTWAKIVRSEFKDVHRKEMGEHVVEGKKIIEDEIIEKRLNQTLIDKTYEKIRNDNNGWKSQYISQLLGRVWHDFVIEETWQIIKDYKNPKVDFKTMQYFCNKKIKELRKDLF